jgi:hypothetical protein
VYAVVIPMWLAVTLTIMGAGRAGALLGWVPLMSPVG